MPNGAGFAAASCAGFVTVGPLTIISGRLALREAEKPPRISYRTRAREQCIGGHIFALWFSIYILAKNSISAQFYGTFHVLPSCILRIPPFRNLFTFSTSAPSFSPNV